MKKTFYAFLLILSLLALPQLCHAEAELGDAVYTDVTTYINHVPIASHNFNGTTLIAAEDLRHFGFDVKWNEYKETLTITRNPSVTKIDVPFVIAPLSQDLGKKEFTVTTTNVRVFTGNYQYASFGGIYGYTLINADDLACIDGVSVVWVPEVKALKIWVDGLEVFDTMLRPVPNITFLEHYDVYDYTYYWDSYNAGNQLILSLYMETDDGVCINNDYGKIIITDVIDADGNSILRHPIYSVAGTTVAPYIFRFSDSPLSIFAILGPDDLYPKTAWENGGLIKFSYAEYGYSQTDSFTLRVDRLPYYYHQL